MTTEEIKKLREQGLTLRAIGKKQVLLNLPCLTG